MTIRSLITVVVRTVGPATAHEMVNVWLSQLTVGDFIALTKRLDREERAS